MTPQEHLERIKAVVECVEFRPHTKDTFTVAFFAGSGDIIYLQHSYLRPDAKTGEMERGYGRKWHISPHATNSEIILTCLKAAITNAEHEVREDFRFMGEPIFQPHQDVRALLTACGTSDARKPPQPLLTDEEHGKFLG